MCGLLSVAHSLMLHLRRQVLSKPWQIRFKAHSSLQIKSGVVRTAIDIPMNFAGVGYIQFDSGVLTKGINQSLAPPLCTSVADQGLDEEVMGLITQVTLLDMGLHIYDHR